MGSPAIVSILGAFSAPSTAEESISSAYWAAATSTTARTSALERVTSATLPSTSPEMTVRVSSSASLTMPTVSTGTASVTVVVCGSAAGEPTLGIRVSAPDAEVPVLSAGFAAGCSGLAVPGRSGVITLSAAGAASNAEAPEVSSAAPFSPSASMLNWSSRPSAAPSALLSTATVRVTYLL